MVLQLVAERKEDRKEDSHGKVVAVVAAAAEVGQEYYLVVELLWGCCQI